MLHSFMHSFGGSQMQPVLIILHQGFQLRNTRRSRDFYDSAIISDQSLKKHLSLRGIDGNSGPVCRYSAEWPNFRTTWAEPKTMLKHFFVADG